MTSKSSNIDMELFDDALIGIFQSTFQGKFNYVNNAFSTILKYESPEELMDAIDNISDQLFTKEYIRPEIIKQIRRDGKVSNYEVQYYCKDGSIITALLNMQTKIDINGDEPYLEGFITDVTPLKEKERQLKENEEALQELNEELEAALQQLTANEEILRSNYGELKEKEESLGCLFNHSPDAIAHFDNQERIISINTEFTQLFGYTLDEVKGRHINEIIDPFCQIEDYLTLDALIKSGSQFWETIRYDRQGNPIHVLAKGAPIVINDKLVGGYCIYTDVRVIKEAKEEITKQQKILESLFNYSPDGIAHLDMNSKVQKINPAFTDLFGYPLEECIGRTVDELITSDEYLAEGHMINELAAQNKTIEIDTVRKHKDGTLVDVCIRGGPIIVDGQMIGDHAIYTDIRGRKEAEAQIKYLSYYDKLTGLYNRAFFEEELKRLDTPRQLPLAIIIGDVNGLKLTNDVFGHEVGDKLLIETAEILKTSCREEDIVCRWGGDEFAILLPNTDKKGVKQICQRIYDLCAKSVDAPIQISISLGYAVKYQKMELITETIKEAEEQMYRNKLLESKSTRSHIIQSLQQSLYERSHETESHGQRMKELSWALGRSLNLDKDKMNELGLLAILHDIGKIAIPDSILQKPGPLTIEEWEKMKRHCEIGYRIAQTAPELIHISKYILFHHERWDGTGYPQGLKGEEIPLLSRIIAVVDVYDVMTNARVYKEPVSHEEAIAELIRCAGTQFDPEVVSKFIELFQ